MIPRFTTAYFGCFYLSLICGFALSFIHARVWVSSGVQKLVCCRAVVVMAGWSGEQHHEAVILV